MSQMREATNRYGLPCGSIMVAVNGGASGWRALTWAAAESSARHSVLRIVHAIDWPRWGLDPLDRPALDRCNSHDPEQGALILDEAARRAQRVAPHATITTHLKAGNAAAAILKAGRSDAVIVIGRSRSRRPGWRSVSRRIVRKARVPVVVVELLDEGVGSSAPRLAVGPGSTGGPQSALDGAYAPGAHEAVGLTATSARPPMPVTSGRWPRRDPGIDEMLTSASVGTGSGVHSRDSSTSSTARHLVPSATPAAPRADRLGGPLRPPARPLPKTFVPTPASREPGGGRS